MKAKVSDLVRRAMMLLDESEEEMEKSMTFGDMGMELRRLAAELAPEAARNVMLSVPLEPVDESISLQGEYSYVGESGTLRLPDDFLKLVQLRMSDWDVALSGFSEPVRLRSDGWQGAVLKHHPDASRTRAEDTILPALLLEHDSGGRLIRIFGTSSVSRPAVAQYLPMPKESYGSVWIPSALADDVAAELARLVREVITT